MSLLCRSGARDKGFTLIEVLVAIGVSAVLLTALYATFFSVFRGGKAASDSLDEHITAGRFVDRFTRDVHGAYFKEKDPFAVFAGAPKGMGSSVTFASFTYPVLKKGFPTSDLTGVSYATEEAEGSLKVFREVWNPYAGEKVRVEVLDRVKSLEIEYYNGSAWVKAWDSNIEKAAPSAVRATVKLENGEEFKVLAMTMIKANI